MKVTGQATIDKAKKILEKRMQQPNQYFCNTTESTDYLSITLSELEHEEFHMLLLDNQHGLIKDVMIAKGTIDGAAVYPREVIKVILEHNAAAIILAHNHPSGTIRPSEADKKITKRIKDIANMIDVRVIDHIIIGGMDSLSFSAEGLL